MKEKEVPLSSEPYKVISPVMGTFYRSSAPDAPPLVTPGQKVEAGEVICIIESMKIFTELRAQKAGIVKAVLLENEEPVMKNQAVMEIEVDGE